ncbi:hypothetical protein scyTo_0000185 [Scyliorhinus torazame]|uniref:Uncharacterized protein n=1 Tax=Scyliorhinus torazame TaxID=75743 RepID=A0A401NS64_SCYTO|nr:hypothetical protein [Scyliorhinus torazame]
MANPPKLHVFGLWEETGAPGGNTRAHGENIWTGDAERTLGARWGRGMVQYFDSYKFLSTSYGDMKYHFKSINTWLQGICVSHCSEHKWNGPTRLPGKRSIFSLGDEGVAADERLNIENLNFQQTQALKETTRKPQTFREPMIVPCDSSMAISTSSQIEPLAMKSKTTKQRENELKATRDMETSKTHASVSRPNAHVNLSEDIQEASPKEIIHLAADNTGVSISQTNYITGAPMNQCLADSANVDTDGGAEGKKVKMAVKPEGKKKKRKQPLDQGTEVVENQVTKTSAPDPSHSGVLTVRFTQHEFRCVFLALLLALAFELLAVYLFVL